jgi:methionyl-tRNA synthetase
MASLQELYSTDLTIYLSNLFGLSRTAVTILLVTIVIWSLIWKGLALWKSARKKSSIWFVVLLVVNSVGILEILYIFIFSKMNFDKIIKKEKMNKKHQDKE